MVTTPLETVPANEAARRPLRAEECALAVIDIQEKLLPPIWESERMVRNSQLLIRMALAMNLPILVSTQYAKGLGRTIPEIASLLPDVNAIDKLEFGCFNRMQAGGAVISSTEMMLYELMGKSGTATFKEMLKWIK